MSKKNKKNGQSQISIGPSVQELGAKIQQKSVEVAAEIGISALPITAEIPTPPEGDGRTAILEAWNDAWKLHEALKGRERRLEKAEAEVRDAKARVDEQAREAEERAREASRKQAELEQRYAAVATRESVLAEREQVVAGREIEASAGFAKQRDEMLAPLEDMAAKLKERITAAHLELGQLEVRAANAKEDALLLQETALKEREAMFSQELRERRGQLEAQANEKGVALEKERDELTRERHQIEAARRKIAFDSEELAEQRRELAERIESRAATLAAADRDELARARRQYEAVAAHRNHLLEVARERDEKDRLLQGRTPGDMLAEINALRSELDAARRELGSRLPGAAAEILRALQAEKQLWENQRFQLTAELADLRAKQNVDAAAVTEVESLRDQRLTLQARCDALHRDLETMRKELDDRVKRSGERPVFPACTQMSEDRALQDRPRLRAGPLDLNAFVTELRSRMARGSPPLYYTERDLRCFLGGLAASRLHILQGISGTGKTSLPRAFAEAIGAGSALIEVQAGWRDRHDLVGHYNAFERTFHETEFMRALYQAARPAHAARPFFVVLDEMNLSHPEQYFADVLSALEQAPISQRLVLLPSPAASAPDGILDGRLLPIPSNVWFVGTANHDETTKDFADKTYDRSHVMELPKRPEAVGASGTAYRKPEPVGVDALQEAFANARRVHEAKAQQAFAFLNNKLAELMADRFRVGWGNRLERQLLAYLPVVVAAGGSTTEALDHVLASKILRKIRERHDIGEDDLRALETMLKCEWIESGAEPTHSLSVVRRELRRLGRAVSAAEA